MTFEWKEKKMNSECPLPEDVMIIHTLALPSTFSFLIIRFFIRTKVLNIGNIGNIGSPKTRKYRWKYR